MNPKSLLLLGLVVLASHGAPPQLHRQKRTLGLIQSAGTAVAGLAGAGLGAAGTALSAAGTALKVGTGVVVGKTILLGLAGNYALYKYLQNRRNREQGINFGVSGGVGAGEGLNFGGSAGFGFGAQEPLADVVYYNAPGPSYASDISYESAPQITYAAAPQPQYATYVEAPVSYVAAPPHVTYAAATPEIYSAPIAISVPVHEQQSIAYDTVAPSSSSSIDSYGAPQAPVIG